MMFLRLKTQRGNLSFHPNFICYRMYTIQQIAAVVHSQPVTLQPANIEHLLIDSRRLVFAATSLFFALETQRNDGALYIDELYTKGVRNFVVSRDLSAQFVDANFLVVEDSLRALQHLTAWHRSRFTIPVIGITGSNGKTMVKEWLYQLLQSDYNIVRSPKSYNSQVGVPLSVWQINEKHTLAIFEAGISQPGEMEYLEKIIKPTMGVLTNIGEAHSQGFTSLAEKGNEKMGLFKNARQFIYCKDCNEQLGATVIDVEKLSNKSINVFTWGTLAKGDITIVQTIKTDGDTTIHAVIAKTNTPVQITIPFTDKASIDNAITCWCVLLLLGYPMPVIVQKMRNLQPLDMRMQLLKGVNNCLIINDSYNNDLSSLELALDYLVQQSSGKKTTLVLSDIYQTGQTTEELIANIKLKIGYRNLTRLILIGPVFSGSANLFKPATIDRRATMSYEFFYSTEDFIQHFNTHHFTNEVILLKGSRVFEFEQLVHLLEEKVHQTVLEVNMAAMVHNLKQYQRGLKPGTKLMAMVKAFSYGSGSVEVANVLQFHKVDYLAVAYVDEGVELRKADIHMPIMVMNPETVTFDLLVEHNLEPEIFSPAILQSFIAYLGKNAITQYPVHIKIDTGMHRLGFDRSQLPQMIEVIKQSNCLVVQSVFSHLAASENPLHDNFTNHQAAEFDAACTLLAEHLGYSFTRHLSNTSAIFRHPGLQYDMVRLGIGLYGVDTTANPKINLQTVLNLRSTIAQLRKVKAGDTVGYSLAGMLTRDSLIATIRIGYADGFSRNLGNGAGKVWVKGQLASVVGNVCMDMIMIDVTDVDEVAEGDAVEIFGPNLPVTEHAGWSKTIAYEVLTGISQRVKRVYYEE